MFGRDALWTSLAVTAYGDFETTRTALGFLGRLQRADGKIPHEISQSATLIPWFGGAYEFPWASADATPLYVAAHADYWRASGDRAFLQQSWDSIRLAWRFTAATDTDGNGLVENTKVGHGWTEGSPPYPPHEEIYLQGAWIAACRGLSELSEVMGDAALAREARERAEMALAAVEKTYWLEGRGFYAFATALPVPEKKYDAEPGPRRAERQRRLESLRGKTIVDEDTVLPAVPMWWRLLDAERAQSEIDHLGGGDMATDWGARIISAKSELYDPLSYHYGSVWPLFTGWSSMAAYRYGRPHVGLQGAMATALLTYQGALGYVTELLSGDLNAPFGRSSHHQVWSEAMVVTPVVRGLFGIEPSDGGRMLTFAPQLPADWSHAAIRGVPAGATRYDFAVRRGTGRMAVTATRREGPGLARLFFAPALPLDATVRSAALDGRPASFRVRRLGDVQLVEVMADSPGPTTTLELVHDPGTDVYVAIEEPERGARSAQLRIVRARAEDAALRLVLDGRAGRTYTLGVRTVREVGAAPGVRVRPAAAGATLEVEFAGPGDGYVRREITLPLR
jgi:glycogen debranching enzyme